LSLTSRIGYTKPNSDYEDNFKALLDLKNCVGILGGESSRAYYIIGRDNHKPSNYFYLDPHHTQEVQKYNNFEDQQNQDQNEYFSYFENKNLNKIKYDSLNCSIQYGFFVKDNKDFANFWQEFERILKNTNKDDTFFSWQEYKIPDVDDLDDIISFD